jgi:hypothetical protein
MMKSDREVRARGVQDEEADLRTRVLFRRAERRFGHVPLPARILARDPKLLELSARMNRYAATPGVVSPKLKELAQLKVAMMVGCPF